MALKGGKNSRAKSKDRRASERRKQRAANKAAYAAMAGTSQNVKKKNAFNKKAGGFNARKHEHLVPDCGNPGCERCEHLHIK